MLRQPMNGLASRALPRYGTFLSPPRSSVRMVTLWFGAASITLRYAASCSSSSGTAGCVRNRYSVRYRPTPTAPQRTAISASGGLLTLASSSTRSPSTETASWSRFSIRRLRMWTYSRWSLR